MALGDFTRINTNLGALSALAALKDLSAQLGVSQTRLASGKRINEAGDDPAGFSIAQKFDIRARGLATALDSVGTFSNVLSIASGAIGNINDLLLQIRDLAVQGSTDTLGSDERAALEQQSDDLSAEVTRLQTQTNFAGQALLDGTFINKRVQTGSLGTENISLGITQNFSLASLGIADASLDFSTSALSSTTIGYIDGALTSVRLAAQTVGSLSNRLVTTQDALAVALNNTTAARSRIMDADVAAEQINVTRLQILQQLSTAQLAQSNVAPQTILALFK